MIAQEHLEEIKKALDNAKSVFVLIPRNPSLDSTAAALALYLVLKETEKSVAIGCPTKMRVEYNRLVGIDQISDKVGNRNLTISFDYKEDSIEKVSYNVEGGRFNLVIQPKSGYPPLDSKSVEFSYEGIEAQVIFVIGAQRLEDLGELYAKEREAFGKATVINIDRAQANTKFGQVNLVEPSSISISELMFSLIKQLGLKMDMDVAGNLLKGIEMQTQNFQAPFTGPDTFEVAAQLLRSGARRTSQLSLGPRPWVPGMAQPQAQVQTQGSQGRFAPPGVMPLPQFPAGVPPTSLNEPELKLSEPIPSQNLISQGPAIDTRGEDRYTGQPTSSPRAQGQNLKPQPDWLKPKILTTKSSKVD